MKVFLIQKNWILNFFCADRGRLALFLIFVALLPLSTPRIYATDEVQYYAYLRSFYFDHDLDFRNEYQHFAAEGLKNHDPSVSNALLSNKPADPIVNPQTGKLRNVAPIGAAILWLPGFLLADGFVRFGNLWGSRIPADGYSKPYIWAICYMSALYALLGLGLTYQLARRFTTIFSATLATITVWLATPLVFYSYISMPWAHAPAFCLFALFLTLWLAEGKSTLANRHAQRSLHDWILLGLVGGLMTSTREQLGIFLLLPVFEGFFAAVHFYQKKEIKRIIALFSNYLLLIGAFLLALTPQLLTYIVLNGRPLPSSTVAGKLGTAGGLSPYFFATLFDLQHGAFLWSPVLPISLIGLIFLARRDWLFALSLFIAFLAQTYINGSFGSTWHLTGAFGFRRLIECTPIFVLGLAMLFERLQNSFGRWPLLFGALFCIYWNFGLLAQWTIVHPEIRKGLIWQEMLAYQFIEVPHQVAEKLIDLLFHRCKLLKNQNC